MLIDFISFFYEDVPHSYDVEFSSCVNDKCTSYAGSINPYYIWEGHLDAVDGSGTCKTSVSVSDIFGLKFNFVLYMDDAPLTLELGYEDCTITKDSIFVKKQHNDHEITACLKKVRNT